jgi:hypothetical protein
MANDKTYDRHVNIWINGKEVKNDISSIKKEMYNLTNEVNRATRGTAEYEQKVAELKKVKAILKEHQENITAAESSWSKLKKSFGAVQVAIVAGLAFMAGAWKGVKEVIGSTDALKDKFERTIGGWKGGIDAFARSLATINEGGLKNLGKKIREGIEEGRRYADSLDAIDEKTRALQIAEAEASNEILKQTEISRSNKYSKDQQIEAGKKIIELEEKLTVIRAGIAQQAYLNESKNIQNATKLTEAEVLAFVKQEDQMVANIEAGKEYNKNLAERNRLQKLADEQSSAGYALMTPEEQTRLQELNTIIAGATEETKKFAFAAANMPGDEKMQLFTDKYVAYQQAIGSGLENTMRTRIRVAKNEDALNKESQTAQEKDLALKERMEQYTDEYFQKEEQRNQKDLSEKERMERYTDEYFQKEEQRNQKDLAEKELMERYTEEYFQNEERRTRIREQNEQKLLELKKNTAQAGQNFISALFDRQAAKLDVQYKQEIAAAGDNAELKAQIEEKYQKKKNALARRAAIFEKAAAVVSIGISVAKGIAEATAAAVVTLGASLLLIPWIIAAGALQAATVIAKPIPQFYKGGDTGPGDKHEIAGYVHKKEWVANADMVASPVFGPVIQALEYARANNLRGYFNGGNVGESASGSGGSGSGPAFVASNPRLEALIEQNIQVNKMMLRNGVHTNFTYDSVDKVRKGMKTLEDIENNASF